MIERSFILPDNRKLQYAIYGAANGYPVLYFHGTPSSRLEIKLLNAYGIDPEQRLLEANIQMIAIDRPGMGLSSFNANGTFISFADDVFALVQSLSISQCSVLGWSGGGPYALAIARKYSSVIKNVFIICGFTRQFTKEITRRMSINKWYFFSAKYIPRLLEVVMNRLRKSNARYSLPQWITSLPDVDYNLIRHPQQLQHLASVSLKEACLNGARGAVYEAGLYFSDPGFALSQIEQPVHYWWGTQDESVIRLHAEAIEGQVQNSVLHYKQGEGHLSIYIHHFTKVVNLIAAINAK